MLPLAGALKGYVPVWGRKLIKLNVYQNTELQAGSTELSQSVSEFVREMLS